MRVYNLSNYHLSKTYNNYKQIQINLDSLGIDYIDVFPELKRSNEIPYYNEGHLNSFGHNIIASKLQWYFTDGFDFIKGSE